MRSGGVNQKRPTELKSVVERLSSIQDESNAPPALSRQLLSADAGSFGIDPRTGLHFSPTMGSLAQEPLDAIFLRKVDDLCVEESAADFCIHPPTYSVIVSEGMPLRCAQAPELSGRFEQISPQSKAYVFTAEAMEALQCFAERHLEDLVAWARDAATAKAKAEAGTPSQMLRKADIELARCTAHVVSRRDCLVCDAQGQQALKFQTPISTLVYSRPWSRSASGMEMRA